MFEINLKQFQGPLDLLLHLVDRAKIDLRDIFVSEITEQYLHIVQSAADCDMEDISAFIAMASELIEIKSRRLLPKPPVEDPDAEDPEEALIRRLEEYRKIRAGSEVMSEIEKQALDLFGKLPQELPQNDEPLHLDGLTVEALWDALLRVGSRRKKRPREVTYTPRAIRRDNYTVQGCIEALESRLSFGPVAFDALLSDEPDREELVTLFCALLEELKLGRAHVEQHGVFGQMTLVPGPRPVEPQEEPPASPKQKKERKPDAMDRSGAGD